MMVFEKTDISHIDLLKSYLALQSWRTCDYSVGAVMMWRNHLDTHHCVTDGCLVMRGKFADGNTYFAYPVGKNIEGALNSIEAYAKENSIDFLLSDVPESQLDFLKQKYGNRMSVSTNRDYWDYLYEADKMRTFGGKKLSSKRNHVNRFKRSYPDCRFVEINENNLARAKEFCKMFVDKLQGDENMSVQEGESSVEMFDYILKIGGFGAFLELDGEIIAVSLGEIVGDTMFIHVEKALHEYSGIYQALVSQFAERFAAENVLYINREEDDGVEGLRKSKLSYYPIALLEKYNVLIGN